MALSVMKQKNKVLYDRVTSGTQFMCEPGAIKPKGKSYSSRGVEEFSK